MSSIPLLAHTSPEDVVAWRAGRAISARQFVADAQALAALLPAGRHVLNVCSDRYRFAIGFAASLIAGRTSLLPPTQVPEVIRQLRSFAPDAFCLTDDAHCDIDLPRLQCPEAHATPPAGFAVPCIDAGLLAAQVFTSGSTGVPLPHAKTWGFLAADVSVGAQRIGFGHARRWAIVATVPPQHMYGLESSLLVAWRAGQAFCAERPFYPADIAATLAAVPRPRLLVSTPVHLRALLAAGIDVPELACVMCATAPLDVQLAAEVESRLGTNVLEIYGSTETGQIASRHTTSGEPWSPWPGVTLQQRDGRVFAQGGHLPAATPLGDLLDVLPDGRFLLRGRTEDMINIAGKRSSLAYLNHQLAAIPGVVDGAFFLPDEALRHSAIGTTRLAAAVVAPGLHSDDILRALRARVDAVFLPRPLLQVERIPRNSTGKLTHAALQALASRAAPRMEPGA